jgi:hypothetical protein
LEAGQGRLVFQGSEKGYSILEKEVVPSAGKEEVASPLGGLGFPEAGAEISNLEEVLLIKSHFLPLAISSPFFFGAGCFFVRRLGLVASSVQSGELKPTSRASGPQSVSNGMVMICARWGK